MFIDTHCHLDFAIFDKTRDTILQNCDELGITHFINPATQRNNWDNLVQLNQQYNNVAFYFGLHPVFIDNHSLSDLDNLEIYTQKYSTKITGEIGLDKRFNNFDKQIEFFSAQIAIAKNLNKRVIIHAVKSHNEVLRIIKDLKFINGGIISHPQSKLKQTLQKINPKNIVLETDSPDMRLYNSSKDINTPENIPTIFKLLNDIYQLNPDILKQQIYNTSLEFI
ncbi:TatD family hydrolase [Francisella noatunensis]|uniref:TatD family hydrolase n=1 Tax=Francisella noatunensis TaxID=657445 RepID=A0A9Q2QF15_9GAMM|nr:TatD family hydrolase [Francisella noatunensis]MBK2028127.1 TatD family hydrolase [Francisella noatunensis]MBK2033726.1 TatD family hydrolase [Francisella noatunensis]MBK2048142.1 TatD family hydrolase [Francisella noatunensis]MBK2049592.1 TatD family hydrolase [Francisella noatunensis]MBK2051170.1 TatD family hydrolase [Francisella noatunensis]